MVLKLFTRRRSVVADDNSSSANPQKQSTLSNIRRPWGTKTPAASQQTAKVLGGKYISKKHASLRSFDTTETEDLSESPSITESPSMTSSWRSCRSRDYQQQQPQLTDQEKRAQWEQAVLDARRLPRSTYMANNIMMVNAERTKRTIPAVKRCSVLDSVAQWHAQAMAAEGRVRHSDAQDLQAMLLCLGEEEEDCCEHLGENVGAGPSIKSIHEEMMGHVGDARNIRDRRYTEMGMATARSPTGELYLCQIFRG